MIEIQNFLDDANLKSIMILQVHDELVFDVHPDEVQLVSDKVCEIMENVVEFDIVMKAEAAVAENWSEAH